MRALLKKEMYFMKSQWVMLIGIFVLFGFLFSFLGMLQVLPSILGGIGMSICINNYSYDETAKFETYALSMPWGVKPLVLARYIATFAMTGLGVAFGVVIAMGYGAIFQKAVNMEFVWGNVAGGLFSILLITLILVPAVFKGGVAKLASSVVIGLVIVGVLTLLLMSVSTLLSNYMPAAQADMATAGFALLMLIAGFLISYRVSLKTLKMK